MEVDVKERVSDGESIFNPFESFERRYKYVSFHPVAAPLRFQLPILTHKFRQHSISLLEGRNQILHSISPPGPEQNVFDKRWLIVVCKSTDASG